MDETKRRPGIRRATMDLLPDIVSAKGAFSLFAIAALPLLLRAMFVSALLGSGRRVFSADGMAMIAVAAFAANSVGALDARSLSRAMAVGIPSPSSFSVEGTARSVERNFRIVARALQAVGP